MKSKSPDVESIFSAAQSFTDIRKREEYLDVACRRNKKLREKVDQLLAAAEKAKAYFDEPLISLTEFESERTSLPKKGTAMRYFGDYEVEREIGRGGMGVIYKARQASLDRSVAIKMILNGNLADKKDVRRFRTEAEAAANLRHSNIVSIHEVGVHEGQHYYSMDWIEGGDLQNRIRDGLYPAGEAAQCLKSVAEAISYAHSQGILHRDLKPQNILLDGQGEPKITDFGLAKKMESATQLTLSGSVMGSPGFMAPEQALADRENISVRTDVYGLGALLYAMITGRAPIQGDNMADTIRRVVDEEPVAPRTLNPKVPLDLETICLKCLSKRPSERYASAEELVEDLERFLRYEPVKARPVGAMRKTWTWWQKNPWKLVGIFGLLTLMMGAVITGLWEQNRLASEQLRFPDVDVRRFLNPFSQSPSIAFLFTLPCCVVLSHLVGRIFRRQLSGEALASRFGELVVPVHALVGAFLFLGAFGFQLSQIRAWVWQLPIEGPYLWIRVLEILAFLSSFALAWVGLVSLWEALGSQESATFRSNVHEHLLRESGREAKRVWALSDLLRFLGKAFVMLSMTGCSILVLLFQTVVHPAVSFTIAATAGCVLALIVRQAGILIRRNIWGARLFLALIYILVFAAGMATTVFLVEWPLILLPGIGLAWSVAIFRNLLEDVRCRCARSEDDETKVIGIKPAVAPWRVAGESLVFLVLLIVGLYMIENVRGARAWKKAKEKAAAAGIETDWSRLVEPPVAEEENFLNAINGGLLDFKEPRSSGAAVIVRPQMANETMPIIPRNWNYSAYGDDPLFDAEQFRSNLLESQYDIPEGEDPVDYWVRIYRDYWSNFFEAAKRPYASYIHSPSAEDAFLETPNYLSLSGRLPVPSLFEEAWHCNRAIRRQP